MAEDIIELVNEREAQSRRRLRRGVIITPGAIGDCLLMLPLAKFMKESLELGGIDFIGHTEYIDFYPGRTCADSVRSIDSIDFHRLFTEVKDFSVEDDDALITAFLRYEWIASFLGDGDGNFEHNLIYTVNCHHSAEVTTLPLAAKSKFSGHISEFYIREFINENCIWVAPPQFSTNDTLIQPTQADLYYGKRFLESQGINTPGKVVLIHPGGGSKEKCWHLDNFCDLARTLDPGNMQLLFVLGPAELERFDDKAMQKIEGLGKCTSNLSLTELMQILACTDLYIGNDSGITHLAAGLGTRTLALFGPTNPTLYRPLGPDVTVFTPEPGSFEKPSAKSVEGAAETIHRIIKSLEP
jgi:heptosyltransferase-3